MDKVTIGQLQAKKERGEPITMLTAYDYPTALLIDQSGIDVILVGDSLGMVVHGFDSTLPVTMDMMVMHCAAVRRGTRRAYLLGDMPFLSYQVTIEEAQRNAGRLLVEGGVDGVKLEGGERMAETVRALVGIGIAVQGHIGLTPQSVSAMGGFKVQGKSLEAARTLLQDARALQDAGAFSLVLEGIPARLAGLISRALRIPTMGIGAGAGCDGQVLVTHDLLGLYDRFTPKFAKQYAQLAEPMRAAFEAYRQEVESRAFPAAEHEFTIADDVWAAIQDELG
jgi:3-methyl-2-oxobutanoate hydroxymethyltransferase